jgi:hypothetical protein
MSKIRPRSPSSPKSHSASLKSATKAAFPQKIVFFGAGELGRRVIALADEKREFEIEVVTRSDRSWSSLPDGIQTHRLADLPENTAKTADLVVVSIPPSQFDPGSFPKFSADSIQRRVMVSSTGIYIENDGGEVDETSDLRDDESPLAKQEAWAVRNGFYRIRLAGLYSEAVGPHRYYLREGQVPRPPESTLNLIHYDDAAAAILALALSPSLPEAVNLSDGHPISRESLYEILKAERSDLEWGQERPGLGKRVNSQYPFPCERKYPSFEDFWSETRS